MHKILIRATNWVGDAVMSLPAVRAVHDRFPDAEIVVLARPWVADLYARETSIGRVIPYAATPGLRDLSAKRRIAGQLRAEQFDLAILMQNAFEAAAIARWAGIPRIIGYDRDGRRMLLTQAIPPPKAGEIPAHERFYYLELLRRAGFLDRLPSEDDPIRLEGAAEAAQEGARRFAERGMKMPVIGISPGAAYGNAKRWLPERFARTAGDLARARGGSVAIFGSAAERELCETVKHVTDAPARNVAGETSLREFIDMAAACAIFLTNDSGAMHIASALGVPTVTVFGATNHVTTGPTGPLARIVCEPVECSPCLLRECPIDHRCMTRVSAERVTEIAKELLRERTL